jgi:hypothetical protein
VSPTGTPTSIPTASPTPSATPTATPTPLPEETLDHFLCYKARARRVRGESRFEKQVGLHDQFQDRTVDLSKVELFCDAVEKRISGRQPEFIINPTAHLTCYSVKRPKTTVKKQVSLTDQLDVPVANMPRSRNPFEMVVQSRRTTLCVPSAAMVVDPSPTPTATPTPITTGTATPTATPTPTPAPVPDPDYFELYKIRRARGEPRFQKLVVKVTDPFLDWSENVELKKPVQLGVPTDKNGEGITDPSAHLTCYSLRAPRFEKRDVEVENQFGQFRLTVKKPNMLCVPSAKQVVTDE